MERLVLISPEFANGRVEFLSGQLPITLGRSRRCDVAIDDPLLSRRHAEIRLTDSGHAELHDMDSTNLTIVNEVDVTSHVLQSGDRILLGETEILVQIILAKEDDPSEKTTRDLTMLPGPKDETVED
ncbi:MAG: FHA domain-containing protein [Planctomycetaceae bacterium]